MPAQPQYLLAYGSILQTQSRQRNIAHPGEPIPVRVRGLRRSWTARGAGVGFTCTFLGVDRDDDAVMNGALVTVADVELPELDRREAGYRRAAVNQESIDCLRDADRQNLADAAVMVYETVEPIAATPAFPVIQSYLDICLQGCLEIDTLVGTGDTFTREFLATTHDWTEHWVNDRLFPRAPFRQVPEAGRIDRMLSERCPEQFARIRIE
ncbi:MAG: hypothetical protein AAF589_06855 [Planctomycetota bacterium]